MAGRTTQITDRDARLSAAWQRACERRARSTQRPMEVGGRWQSNEEESRGALPERAQSSLVVRCAIRLIQALCLVYGLVILWWVWMAKDFSVGLLLGDPVFHGYSLIVTGYVISRFALAPFYKPSADRGHRPSISIVIPAYNEADCIEDTIDACFTTDYPKDLLEVVVVDDGSSDDTWRRILLARRRHEGLQCVRFARNCGKRAAMAEGIRRSAGEVIVFVDSDSVLEPDGLRHLVADFADPRVGAVVGSADVLNKNATVLTKMQQVRYYVAFRVIKGSESIFGAVTCASGCFSGYRREALLSVLERWENQTFLGRRSTFGDDRALTNYVLRNWRVTYNSKARSHTIVPEELRPFFRQQLRWKKSWLRESLHVSRFMWRKHPGASIPTYFGILFPWVAPLVVVNAVIVRSVSFGDPWMYLIGVYAMAILYSLYYGISRRSPLWYHGLTFVAVYMSVLVWQTYYALATIRNSGWGTRASFHNDSAGEVTVIPSAASASGG